MEGGGEELVFALSSGVEGGRRVVARGRDVSWRVDGTRLGRGSGSGGGRGRAKELERFGSFILLARGDGCACVWSGVWGGIGNGVGVGKRAVDHVENGDHLRRNSPGFFVIGGGGGGGELAMCVKVSRRDVGGRGVERIAFFVKGGESISGGGDGWTEVAGELLRPVGKGLSASTDFRH
jgi:hypothetical protein